MLRLNLRHVCRRQAGEPLPPPPKTAIAGPEYFGLTHPDVIFQIESLDPDHLCSKYWNGKQVSTSRQASTHPHF